MAPAPAQIGRGPAIDIRPTSGPEALAWFRNGQSVDITGVPGSLDYNPDTEETPGDIAIGSSMTVRL